MLKTEMRNPRTMHIDRMSIPEMLQVMSDENFNAVRAVENELESIGRAVEAVSSAFGAGGRLIYVGAGTSGRLGVLDASECPPTYGVNEGMVVGLMAGGDTALRRAGEAEEDSPDAGVEELKALKLNERDVVTGISAAGGAAYVVRAVEYAASIGCTTIGITSNRGSRLDELAAISICTDTGAEVVTGSTRMKAGTAQKLVLNMLTTASMICCGYVYENMMVNLQPSNAKLKQRMVGIVQEILKCDEDRARGCLEACQWSIPRVIEAYAEPEA